MNNKPLNILVSAYACGPNWGSEIGMGWHWVIHLSQYCQLHVITETGFKADIENKLPELDLKYTPVFYYNNIGERGRKLFWKQGSFSFYKYYKNWQYKTYKISLKIIKNNRIDLIHQLNMIGFREPGFLWKINSLPFIIGPLGGIDTFPYSYLKFLPFNNRVFTVGKNLYSNLQFKYSRRFNKAGKRANLIYAATNEGHIRLTKKFGKKVILLNETGCELRDIIYKEKGVDGILKLLWVGRFEERKALPLALETIKNVKDLIKINLTIVGDGPMENYCKELVKEYNIADLIDWKGRIENEAVQKLMNNSNLFFFTSLREGTPHVVTEAIQNGLPVLCHNACGQGSVIDDSCGIKIPMYNPKTSIVEFSKALVNLANDKNLLFRLSGGALKRSKEISWNAKANNMFETYKLLINDH